MRSCWRACSRCRSMRPASNCATYGISPFDRYAERSAASSPVCALSACRFVPSGVLAIWSKHSQESAHERAPKGKHLPLANAQPVCPVDVSHTIGSTHLKDRSHNDDFSSRIRYICSSHKEVSATEYWYCGLCRSCLCSASPSSYLTLTPSFGGRFRGSRHGAALPCRGASQSLRPPSAFSAVSQSCGYVS